MARICSVCGKKADTMLYTANKIGNSVFCEECYAKIPDYKPNEKFDSLEEVQNKQNIILDEAERNHFPVNVQNDIRTYYEAVKERLADSDREKLVQERLHWITTTPSFEGYKIRAYHGIVSGEVILGTGIGSGIDFSIADWTGTESYAYKNKIDQAREKALERAMYEALKLGGNAIVGAKMDLETMYNSDLVCILVTGTSVTIAKDSE